MYQYRSDLSISDFVLVPPENLAVALHNNNFLSDLNPLEEVQINDGKEGRSSFPPSSRIKGVSGGGGKGGVLKSS